MHDTQRKLLAYAKESTLNGKTLREIGGAVSEPHPQKVKHHLEQLISKGYLQRNDDGGLFVVELDNVTESGSLSAIPIVGTANCGPAEMLATENIEGYLKVSPSLIPPNHAIFAVKAKGSSMNRASIHNSSVEEGDYILIDATDKNVTNGDYVLSVIDGYANIKRLYLDPKERIISLVSESADVIPPIVIDPSEVNYYLNGKVLRIIRSPKSLLRPELSA